MYECDAVANCETGDPDVLRSILDKYSVYQHSESTDGRNQM